MLQETHTLSTFEMNDVVLGNTYKRSSQLGNPEHREEGIAHVLGNGEYDSHSNTQEPTYHLQRLT